MSSELDVLLDEIDRSIESATMLDCFQLGLALKVIEDKLWCIDEKNAQRCNDLQHKIFNIKENDYV